MPVDLDRVLGPELGFTPAKTPPRAAIDGDTVRLEPVDPARHVADLYALSKDDDTIWNYMGYGPFAEPEAMQAWLETCAASADPLFLAVIDKASGRASGMVSFMRMTEAMGVIEIGHIWFAPVLQKTRQATETIFLIMREVFEAWGYRRLEWKCNDRNAPSRAAADRFGFAFEGIFRQHMVIRGRNRDTAWFAMTDGDWPAIGAAFRTWLDPSNFDAAGRQKAALAARRSRP